MPKIPDEFYLRQLKRLVLARSAEREALAAATPKEEKVRHVLRAGQARDHVCHWPGCGRQVPPARWGCRSCWFKLPKRLRDKVWAAYRPGQEDEMTPSLEYLAVAEEVQQWIRQNHPTRGRHAPS